MTEEELRKIETELEKRGYRKFTRALTSRESYAWFKNFDVDETANVRGYQIAFRVWGPYLVGDVEDTYGFDFWSSPLCDDRWCDCECGWSPAKDIDFFETLARGYFDLITKLTQK